MSQPIKLYSVADVVGLFPSDTVKPKDVDEALERTGRYRRLGKAKVLTDDDLRDLIADLLVAKTEDIPPPDAEPGQLLVIGNPTDVEALAWIGWAPFGKELIALDRVRIGAQEPTMILAAVTMSFGEHKAFRETWKKLHVFGHWFTRGASMMAAVEKLVKAEMETGDDE